ARGDVGGRRGRPPPLAPPPTDGRGERGALVGGAARAVRRGGHAGGAARRGAARRRRRRARAHRGPHANDADGSFRRAAAPPMMSLRLLALLLVFAVAPRVAAQAQPAAAEAAQQHVLEIRDGRMHLDGRALPPENLPDGLDLRGIEMTYSFVGPVSPVLEIDGVV